LATLTLRKDGKLLQCIEIDAKKDATLRKWSALQIWKRLVQYVQGDLNDKDEPRNFTALVEECMAWNGLVGIPEELARQKANLFRTIVAGGKRSTIRNIDPFKLCSDGITPEEGAIKYQKNFVPILRWLSRDPELGNDAQAQEGLQAWPFLWEHGDENISLALVIHKNRERSFFSFKVAKYGTVASPICRFILDRLDYYAKAEDKTDIIPLKVCAYCSRIMFFERSSRKTCSDACRVAMCRKGL
jgi:hypothetical protein